MPSDTPRSSALPRQQRTVVDAVVLFPTQGWSGVLSDRMAERREIEGPSIRCIEGVVDEHLIVLATPKALADQALSMEQALRAIFAAYQPSWLIIAGPGRADAQPGEVVVFEPDATDSTNADQAWCAEFLQAASAFGARLAMVIAFREPEQDIAPGMLNIEQQRTLAGKAGATLAALWKKPTAAAELVQRKLVQLDQQNQIADRITELLKDEV